MEKQLVTRKLKKADIWFLGLTVTFAIGCIIWYQSKYQSPGSQVELSVDGKVYGHYALDENADIPIVIDGINTNTLRIKGGIAYMVWAICPDQLCVHHKKIKNQGETIVCLPNKVVVTITGGTEPQFDSVAE